MKLKETVWLDSLNFGNDFRGGGLNICKGGVLHAFSVPKKARFLKLIAHDRPHADRVEVTKRLSLYVDGLHTTFYYSIGTLVRRLLKHRKAIYVECWYK